MNIIFGFHPLDLGIVVISLLSVLFVGWWVGRKVKGESDFFVGGRHMGPWLQFFINFGQATDSNGAPTIATEVYRQGAGGMWIGFQTLFITPFIWFTSIWFRRTRLMTGADLFIERFRCRSLATFFASVVLLTTPLVLGLGNIISCKVATAMIVKSESAYTPEDRAAIARYKEYQELRTAFTAGTLAPKKRARYEELDSMAKTGRLPAEISYITPFPFYIAYTLIVATYIMLGGLKAAAITDAIQGLLIIAFSLIMIPVGLGKLGGFAGLHQRVPEHYFNIFGSDLGDYTWYSIAAIVFASLITFGNPSASVVSASGRDERSIRIGMLSGVFLKRFVMIAWMFCGLLAVALLPGGLSDADTTWGSLSRALLGPGLMGIMITGMLLGHMPAVGVNAINFSATFTRNVYEELLPGLSQKHYLVVAKCAIAGVLILALLFSLFFSGVISLLSSLITFGTFFGAVGFLIYFWRRLTARAVWCGTFIWIFLMVVVAWGLPSLESFRRMPSLLLCTPETTARVYAAAKAEDVAKGLAETVGQSIERTTVIAPKPIFFEEIALVDPADVSKGYEGLKRFQFENWLSWRLGLPLERWGSAGLITNRWMMDAMLPFILLISISLLTPRPRPESAEFARLARFYARLKTPVKSDLAEDALEVAASEANPTRYDHRKMFPGTDWEFTCWTMGDYLGFFGCWAGVLAILAFLWGILQIGA